MKLKFSKKACRESSVMIYCGSQAVGMVTSFATNDHQPRTFFPELKFHEKRGSVEEAEQLVREQFKRFLRGILEQ